MPALFCRRIHIIKMLRDSGMGVKAVYYVEQLRILRGLLRQVGRTAAAQDHYVDLIFPLLHVSYRANRCRLRQD